MTLPLRHLHSNLSAQPLCQPLLHRLLLLAASIGQTIPLPRQQTLQLCPLKSFHLSPPRAHFRHSKCHLSLKRWVNQWTNSPTLCLNLSSTRSILQVDSVLTLKASHQKTNQQRVKHKHPLEGLPETPRKAHAARDETADEVWGCVRCLIFASTHPKPHFLLIM